MEEFVTIKDNVQFELVEKKSRFIANLFYVESTQEAENIIKDIRKKYYDAKHNCIAYRIIDNGRIVEKASDDGEPSGTAGAPMLNILQKNNLANVLIIVTRYFGGILLGTGGLVRAYSAGLLGALEKSEKIQKCVGYELKVCLKYSEFESFRYYCKINRIKIVNIQYFEDIVCNIELNQKMREKLMEDYDTKKVNILKLEFLSIKYIDKV